MCSKPNVYRLKRKLNLLVLNPERQSVLRADSPFLSMAEARGFSEKTR
jgi:hypothetical protein